MRSVVPAVLLVAGLAACGMCGKGDAPPPPSSGRLLTQESGPSHTAGPTNNGGGADDDSQYIFFNQCALCHGALGKGDGVNAQGFPTKPRDYTDAKWQTSVTDDDIKKIILQGGKAVGKSPLMPDFARLRDQPATIDGLVKIIRGFGKPK